jgi:hypothetical protein
MSKPIFGLLLGGILGIFDGLSALISAPAVAPDIVGIVIGSTVKGLIAGVLIGWFSKKVDSMPLALAFGLVVGAALAGLVVWGQVAGGQPAYVWEIVLPGSIVGLIVGFATQRWTPTPRSRQAA